MNRIPLFVAFFTLSILFDLGAETSGNPAQVEVAAVVEGVDINSLVNKKLLTAGGAQPVKLPKVTLKAGSTATVTISEEFRYPVDFESDNTPKTFETADLGVVLTIKPYIVNGEINFSGNLLLSTAEKAESKPASGDIPTIRSARKIFSGKVKSGERVHYAALSPDGEKVTLFLTLTWLDETGRPVK